MGKAVGGVARQRPTPKEAILPSASRGPAGKP